ncbi:MAG: hypothetical protein IJV22_02935 [Bacteroidales bacterium]|nr:hypothetical protein [Bacteroidales bacterium]
MLAYAILSLLVAVYAILSLLVVAYAILSLLVAAYAIPSLLVAAYAILSLLVAAYAIPTGGCLTYPCHAIDMSLRRKAEGCDRHQRKDYLFLHHILCVFVVCVLHCLYRLCYVVFIDVSFRYSILTGGCLCYPYWWLLNLPLSCWLILLSFVLVCPALIGDVVFSFIIVLVPFIVFAPL